MTSAELEAQFKSLGIVRGGILMLRAQAAKDLVEQAQQAKIAVLGVGAFRLTPDRTEPVMANSLDLSTAATSEDAWVAAKRFLESQTQLELYYEIVLE